jgi:putative ABC transport system permease protein
VTLCLIGGAIGIALGVAGSYLIATFAEWPILLRPDTVALGIAASVVVGVVFGLLPSRRAASLNPIEALRHE